MFYFLNIGKTVIHFSNYRKVNKAILSIYKYELEASESIEVVLLVHHFY